ncbi:hypothetical protein SLS58_006582 [Diplodia intermedia]|uniref:Uncharacterized protein n=1 Tax=Diplodia intermedia TaxID=856260 RepID=A0ABR3TMK9_9PEZI
MGPKKASKWTETHQVNLRYLHALFQASDEDLKDETPANLERMFDKDDHDAIEIVRSAMQRMTNIQDILTPELSRALDEVLGLVDEARNKMISDLERKAQDRKTSLRRNKARHARKINVRDLRIKRLTERYEEAQQAAEAAREEHDDRIARLTEAHREEIANAKRQWQQTTLELQSDHEAMLRQARETEKHVRDLLGEAEKSAEGIIATNIQSAKALADLQSAMSASSSEQQQRSAEQTTHAFQQVEQARSEMKESCKREMEELKKRLEDSKAEAVLAEKEAAETRAQGQKMASDMLQKTQLEIQNSKHEASVQELKHSHGKQLKELRDECEKQEKTYAQLTSQALEDKDKQHARELATILDCYNESTTEFREEYQREFDAQKKGLEKARQEERLALEEEANAKQEELRRQMSEQATTMQRREEDWQHKMELKDQIHSNAMDTLQQNLEQECKDKLKEEELDHLDALQRERELHESTDATVNARNETIKQQIQQIKLISQESADHLASLNKCEKCHLELSHKVLVLEEHLRKQGEPLDYYLEQINELSGKNDAFQGMLDQKEQSLQSVCADLEAARGSMQTWEKRYRQVKKEQESTKEELEKKKKALSAETQSKVVFQTQAKECAKSRAAEKKAADDRIRELNGDIRNLCQTVKKCTSTMAFLRSASQTVEKVRGEEYERFLSRTNYLQDALTQAEAELEYKDGLCARLTVRVDELASRVRERILQKKEMVRDFNAMRSRDIEIHKQVCLRVVTAYLEVSDLRAHVRREESRSRTRAHQIQACRKMLAELRGDKKALMDALKDSKEECKNALKDVKEKYKNALKDSEEECKKRGTLLAFCQWRIHVYTTWLHRMTSLAQESMGVIQELQEDLDKYKIARDTAWRSILPWAGGTPGAAGTRGAGGGSGDAGGAGGAD